MNLTFSDAIELVLRDNGNFAPLKYIYDNFEKYREKTGKTPDNTIQERVQRDERFTRIAKGVYALTEFIEETIKNDLGNFEIDNNIVEFKRRDITDRISSVKMRIGQNDFRSNLFKEMNSCPITGIIDEKLLIASHIKPWIHSSNDERLNPKNGFLLSPLFDRLFDKNIGLITFTTNKEIIISRRISNFNMNIINVQNKQKFENLPINGREEFLEYHNKYIFQG